MLVRGTPGHPTQLRGVGGSSAEQGQEDPGIVGPQTERPQVLSQAHLQLLLLVASPALSSPEDLRLATRPAPRWGDVLTRRSG